MHLRHCWIGCQPTGAQTDEDICEEHDCEDGSDVGYDDADANGDCADDDDDDFCAFGDDDGDDDRYVVADDDCDDDGVDDGDDDGDNYCDGDCDGDGDDDCDGDGDGKGHNDCDDIDTGEDDDDNVNECKVFLHIGTESPNYEVVPLKCQKLHGVINSNHKTYKPKQNKQCKDVLNTPRKTTHTQPR